MEHKRIIVLANSIKKSERCIAGIEVGDGMQLVPAGWIRPISGESEGELAFRHMRVEGGGPVAVLDLMEVPFTEHAKDVIHPEDWIVDTSRKWTRIGKLDPKALVTLEEKPKDLWLESTTATDRVTAAFLIPRLNHQSLYLVRPTDFRVELSFEYDSYKDKNRKKTRAKFTYRGQEYQMGLTDPVFTDRHCKTFPALGEEALIVRPPYGDNCLLCVSLTPVFNGYHYKVVATVLELP